ncbi:uncharacterized protein LOC126838814 isoform X3 [Adelges cooleyi]|uniref:uncharacterized protein LOC126838814 isoform X3 n=1 Tax=Adelges cooleyi TaxID=133065 RepID=UPI00217F4CE7|nr:uncharacterized protein LOC126838814 isoform X3 [Adelges cooleyi]
MDCWREEFSHLIHNLTMASVGNNNKINTCKNVNSEGKADKAGIQEGCLINTINSAPVDHLTSSEAQALVRNSSSTLALGINRQTKSHDAVQNDQHRKVEVKATVDKNKPVNETEGQTGNKKGKKVRKRRRKKKPANRINSPEDGQQSNAGPVKIVEQVTKSLPKIEIVSASSDLRVDELEWIKNNEALLISELETRRQAGSPIQVLVRVEKITPSRPEYCQILPDCCHLDVINEETSASASDEDPKRERPTMPEGPSSNGIDPVEMVENKNGDSVQVDSISESVCRSVGEPETKLESPSLVRKSQELRYAESQVPTKNDDATFVEQIDSDDDVTVKEMDCVKRESTAVNCSSWTVTTKSENYANGFMKLNDILQDDNVVLDKFDEYDSYNEEQQRLITDMFPIMESQSEEQDYKEVGVRDVAAVVNGRLTAAHPRGKEFLETVGHDGYGAHDRHRLGPYQYSSDDSTVKDYEVRARVKHHARTDRGRRQIDVRSVYEKLRAVARLIRDDTDDYEDTTSYRTVSGGPSDLDTDSDWLSYTLSDEGESSRSLCLSPSQQSRAPSTASEASDIIELHKKFSDRAKIPNPCRSTTVDDLVEILGYGPPPSSPTCPTYSAEVIDEACRMCGTSDEPLSDAHRLVSLRKYQETRSSRLLNVIQQECRRSDRSASTVAIDRPPTMTDSNNNNNNDNCTFIDTLSVPDNQTRELMYAEYMEKVKERERRLNNKVIRITRPGRPLSSSYGTQLDVDAEFVAKARERLEKLGVDTTDMEFVEPKHDQNGYPRHLMDIVPEDEVCIEEVRMSGVWSPEVKHRTLNLENAVSRKTEKKPPTPSSELPPVWTPNSSPTPERKAYKPVRFESPTLSRKQINGDTQKVGPKKPSDLHVLSSPYPPAPPLLSQNSQGDDNAHRGTERRLPRVQSPTITLLQKAREGQLPRGSAYLDPEESNMNKENKNKGSSGKRNVDTKTINFTARRDYASGSEEKKQRKMLETSPKKYDGIGPTTKEGVPIVLRSEVKEPDQQKWYKQMYESLHKFQTDDDGVTVRYRTITREPKSRNTNGYLSEPERGYESYDDEYSRLSPVKSGQDRYKNQPRPIENYEPGHSSIAEKETRQWWDEAINAFDEHVEQKIPLPHNRSSSKKSNLAQALKESGYDSDSTLVFRRGENQPQCLSPTEQKTAYKMIQNGGEVPFQGLRKAAPERPKDLEMDYLPITSHLTRIHVTKYDDQVFHHPWKEVTCYPVFSTFKRTAKSSASSSGSPPTPPRRDSSRKNSRLERWSKGADVESNVEVKVLKPKSENEKRSKSLSLKSSTKLCKSDSKKEKEKTLKVTVAVSTKGRELKRSATSSTNSSESSIPKRTKSLSIPSKISVTSKSSQKIISKEKIPKTTLVKSNSSKKVIKKSDDKATIKPSLSNSKKLESKEPDSQFGEEFFQQLLISKETNDQKSPASQLKKKDTVSVLKRRESKLDVYLTSKKPVSQSRFKSYDKFSSDASEWEQLSEDASNYLKGRSASEPPSRSPSSRRIRSFHTPVKLIESVTGVRRCRRSKSADEPMERARNAAIDYEYQTYVKELRHSSKKSERFKDLHNFYCSLERLGELEKSAEKANNKVRSRGSLIDFDKWKTIRVKERAETEIKSLQANLENIQKSKDVLFKTKDPAEIRWKRNMDRGLRNRESSVEDLKRKFHAIGNETYRKPELNVYMPLWRGSSVQDVANSLKYTTSSKRGRPISEDRERSRTSIPTRKPRSRSPANIGCRIWSSLSMEQLNRLKKQLNEVYSTLSDLRRDKCTKSVEKVESKNDYEIEVSGRVKRSNASSSLYVRSSSMGPRRKKEELEHCIRRADSIGSVCLTESEKKKISKCISNEVLEKKNKKLSTNVVIPKETLGAVAAVKCKTAGSECVSPRTCYSIDVSEEESTAKHFEKNNYVLVLADNEDKKKMVTDWANGTNNYSESSSSASTVIHLGPKKTTLHSSQSFTTMKSMFGEREGMRRVLSPSPDRFSQNSRSVEYGAVRKLCRRFESFDDLRSFQNEFTPNALKKYKSDPEMHRNVIKYHEYGDVQNLKSKYERSRSPVPKCPLRPDNRLMPRINIISKLACLQDRLARGEVDRIRRMFENKNRVFMLGQFYTSTPDLREARKMIPFLDCSWMAHRYPEPEPAPRSRIRPKSASPVRCSKKNHHHPSILKQPKQDGFLSQPYNPEAHRPKYRWTPVWNGVWTQQPTLPPKPSVVKFKDSPHKYAESEVTLQYRRPVRNEIKEEWSEEELAMKQAEAMRRIYQEERRRKYLQELQDMSNRRHADNLLPSQKSPIALNRYDDFLDESPQPPRSRTPEPKLVARALYNFIGQTSRELSFRKGDIIFVRKQIDKNWYEGEHNAMVGLFPFNYVEVIPYDGVRTTPHRPYEGQARAKFNFLAQTNMELSLVKGELVVLTRRVDNNWYEGRIGSRKGIFPVSYVTVLVEPGDAPSSSMSASAKPVASPASHSLITSNPPNTQHTYQPDSYSSMPTRTSGTQTKKLANNNMSETLHVDVHSEPIPYRALYNYKPQNNDELELREGDVVFVMEKCDDGWYVGSSKRTGCFGTFPGNYVQRSV